MYSRDIPHIPISINRKEFVDCIFDHGLFLSRNYDTLIIAVQIGDFFVNSPSSQRVCTWCNRSSKEPFMKWPIIPAYSNELAHVCLVLASKLNEDFQYSIVNAANAVNNGIVYKMEWEVFMKFNCYLPSRNIISGLQPILIRVYERITDNFGPIFLQLFQDICYDISLINANPFTILLASKMLYRKGRLRASIVVRQKYLLQLLTQVSLEYEIPISNLFRAFIQSR